MNTCKVCRSSNVKVLARLFPEQGGSCDALRCAQCGLVWVHPLPDLSTEFLNLLYGQTYTEEIRELERDERSQRILYEATMRQMDKVEAMLPRATRRALNVGAMTIASKVLMERGWELLSVEVSAYAAESARKQWDVHVLEGKIEEVVLPEEHFDFVKFSHVIEHLADPLTVLAKLWKTLSPGGLLLVETDNAGSLKTAIESAVRRLFGETVSAKLVFLLTKKNLRKRYGRLLPYEHICLFRQQSMVTALRQTNFEIIEILRPAQGDATWFPYTTQSQKWSLAEKFMIQVDQLGAKFGAGEVLVVFARKPESLK